MDDRSKRVMQEHLAAAHGALDQARVNNSDTTQLHYAVSKVVIVLEAIVAELGPSAHADAVASAIKPGS